MSLRPGRTMPRDERDWTRWCDQQDTWTHIVKSVDEPKASDDTLAYDSELSLIVKANRTYIFRGRVWFDTASIPDFQFQFDGPASPTRIRTAGGYVVAGGSAFTDFSDVAYQQAYAALGTTNGGFVRFDGLLVNGANEGQFGFQWAQNTSNASATTVRAGSYIEYLQI